MLGTYDIVIVGGGPAGLAAAIYGRRAEKSVLVLEKNGFGGQIAWSPMVDNFPGIPSVSGAELADRMFSQALDMGAEAEFAGHRAPARGGRLRRRHARRRLCRKGRHPRHRRSAPQARSRARGGARWKRRLLLRGLRRGLLQGQARGGRRRRRRRAPGRAAARQRLL